ncbi:MAG: hypothetical protein ACYTEQ_15935 [Planctomycetota bacterium]|jgi:hypothetical protein
MKPNRERKWKKLKPKSLEEKLRRLPDVDVPQRLKARLLAAIPVGKDTPSREVQFRWFPRAWDFGVTAAAAVMIIASLLLVNYGLSVPSQTLLTEFDDTSLCYPRWDQNDFLFGQNSTYVQKILHGESNKPG